ncbi:MAG: TolC family protein [Rubrivivax sp.]|jgi:multidrug efflux system outer membrane protein|nr:TolC family protein [Rubrivivax sp.]
MARVRRLDSAPPRPGRVAAVVATGALLLAGCAGAPEAPPPPAPVAALTAPLAASAPAADTARQALAPFWLGFGDAELSAAVTRALAANVDLRSADARLREARALAGLADAAAAPRVGAEAAVSRSRADEQTTNRFYVGLVAAWELDLFGALAADRAAAQASVRASELGREALRVAVAAETAGAFFELRGAQARREIAVRALEAQRAGLKLLEARLAAGRNTAFDVERARTLVAGTAASVPAFDQAIERSRLRLATLLAEPPQALAGRWAPPAPLPALPARPLAGIDDPRALLQRRPDLAVAEAQFVAATAATEAERRRRWPQVTLGGQIGLNQGRLADLGSSSAFVAGLGASLAWSLIDGGARAARIEGADARAEQAALAYEGAVRRALEEASAALDAYTRLAEQADALYTAAQASGRAAELSRALFRAGSTDFLAVLDAERERLAAADRLAQVQTAQALAVLDIYRAFAGSW